ncbi:MAG: SLAC1 anion channel family protein [Campylobacterota bacterium]
MSDSKCESVPSNRLQFFPIMMFAVVMGLSGLTIVFQKAGQILGFGGNVGMVLAVIDMIIFAVIVGFYLLKLFTYFGEVKQEFSHPVRINFFAATAISFLLMAIIFHSINHDVAFYLFIVGTVMQTFFTFYTISFWINKNLEIKHSNPAWFIPIVGNVLVPVAGAGMVSADFLLYYFAVGVFFWIVMTAILINRIIFHHQLAVKFIPTLFIFIAPPAISFIAYMQLFGSYDVFAKILLDLALFFTFLLFFMYKNFTNLKFFISWWAFTFPLAAVSIAVMLAYKVTGALFFQGLSFLFIGVTLFVVLLVSIKTLQHMKAKEICIQE